MDSPFPRLTRLRSPQECSFRGQPECDPIKKEWEAVKPKRDSPHKHQVFFVHDLFIHDRVASGELNVNFCPMEDMLGDFFTKPLQGAPFCRFKDRVLNINA